MYQGLSEESTMIYKFINGVGKNLAIKYCMKQYGNGLAGMDKIWQLALEFERCGDPLTEEEARELIVNCVNDFLTAVNNNQQLKPLLRDYPFTANNIDLTIFNYDKNRSLYQYPSIANV
jgi:hypothetical protein